MQDACISTHLTILTNANIFESWSALNFNFIDENADASSVSGDLTHGTTQSRSLLLQTEEQREGKTKCEFHKFS